MIKAVIIGFSHMHVNEIALYISQQPDMELAAISDVSSGIEETPPYRYTAKWNLENVKSCYCNNVYENYIEMLDEIKPDIAFILSENCQKHTIVEECAKRGVNVCIEKPMAMNCKDAEKIAACVKKYSIKAVVNWPVAWRTYLYKLKAVLDSGKIGEPIKMRYINGHTGPLGKGARHRGVCADAEEMSDEMRAKTWWHQISHGGGVYLDIACYGCYFTKWLMGEGAKTAIAYGSNLNTPFGDTDDNFAAVIGYDKKMSVIEGTWTTPRSVIPAGPMVLCTDGIVMCTGKTEDEPDVKAYDIYGNEIDLGNIKKEKCYENMAWQYADHIINGAPIGQMLTLEANMEVMKILDAVMRASESGKTENI